MMALLNLPEHHYSHYKDHHYAGIPAQNMLLGMHIISCSLCIMLTNITNGHLERSGEGSNPNCQPLARLLVYREG